MLQSNASAHLSKFEHAIPSGAEWHLETRDWVVLQLREGIAYAINRDGSKEIPRGGLIICPPNSRVAMTASVLGPAKCIGTAIRVSSLAGILTAQERQCLETDVARQCEPFVALPFDHPLSARVTQILELEGEVNLASRLALVQTFAELLAPQLHAALLQARQMEKRQQDAKGRLHQIIGQIPESELFNLSLGEMAKMLRCCERHASRLFREEWGTGFLTYISDLRLKRACSLLLQGNMKIIDVALESGHGSLTHFNYAFKKKFRMTPTQWREQNLAPAPRPVRSLAPRRAQQMAGVMMCLLLMALGTWKSFGAAGPAGAATNAPAASVRSNAPAAPPTLVFRVDHYAVNGNTLLDSNAVSNLLQPYTGEAIGAETISKALGALQMEYFRRGFANVKVAVPKQDLTNNVLVLQVTEGRIGSVKVLHNHYYSSNNIMAVLPYVRALQTNGNVINTNLFQPELDRANANPDRQISPELRPGLEPGTSALILDVKDRLPLHGRLEADNYSPPGTPELRINANVSYGNLWQLDHTLGLQYGFSPEQNKPSLGEDTHLSYNELDGPEVAYYSGYYRAPLGPITSAEDQISADPTHFGYNETTRQFVQPPPIGRPEFTAYASRSTTGPTIYGPETTVINSSILTIDKQQVSQQYTTQTTAGGRFSFPLSTWHEIQSSFSMGLDYKEDKVVTLPTNEFFYTTVVHNGNNSMAPPIITESMIGIAGTKTYPALQYVPLFLGWTGSRVDHWAQFEAPLNRSSQINSSFSLVAGTGGMFSKPTSFPTLIGNTPEATTEFVAVRPQISRLQVLPDDFSLFANLSGQWASEPLLNLEQFELGGNGSVRGYREGEYYSDTGWYGQAEVRTPVYWRGTSMRVGTQLTAFTDYGEGFQLNQSIAPGSHSLWGAGAGLNFNFGPYVESHFLIAWPLLDSPFTTAGHERLSFSLSAQL